MRKLIAAINMTLDGFCDHTAVIPDEEIHDHYTDLLKNAGAILYGRITFGLMEYWRPMVKNPSGTRSMDDFAQVMDRIPKIVFSRTLQHVDWESASLASGSVEEVVASLKKQPGRDILVGSPSLIVKALNLQLLDELQLCVHPVIAGGGLPLFKDVDGRFELKHVRTKSFGSGAKLLCYEPLKKGEKLSASL